MVGLYAWARQCLGQRYSESCRQSQGSVLLVDVCANCGATTEIRWDCLDGITINNDECGDLDDTYTNGAYRSLHVDTLEKEITAQSIHSKRELRRVQTYEH